MSRSRPVAVAVLSLTTALSISAPATAALSKPARLLVPSGATALYWSYPMPLPGGVHYGTLKVTNPSVIARVRAMINAIPVSNYPKLQACPADAMVPFVVRFSTSTAGAAFSKVVFQLAGCPEATVYQHGVAQRPTLGGWSLPTLYHSIQKVISPGGVPLA
ncbi:MAG: hypothetical protein ACHQFZ_02080 [Acidimicrobiales bacterium]